MENLEKVFKSLDVLVVDDMEAMRSMVSGCLRELGVQRIHASPNGRVAWSQIQNRKIDMIICDWDMPEISGLDLLRLVRESDKYKSIPFLMLTATIDKNSVMEALGLGVNDYLSKPFKPKELEYRVIKLLRKVKKAS